MDRTSGELHLGVCAFVNLDDDFAVAGLDHGTQDAANGLDAIALLQILQHVLALLLLLALSALEEQEKQQEDDGDGENRIAHDPEPGRRGLRRRRDRLRRLCEEKVRQFNQASSQAGSLSSSDSAEFGGPMTQRGSLRQNDANSPPPIDRRMSAINRW